MTLKKIDKLTEEQKEKLLAKKYERLTSTDLYKAVEDRGETNDRGYKYAVNTKILKKLYDAFIIGATDMEACLNANIGTSTLYNFQVEFPSLLELKQLWKYNPILQARNSVLQGIKKTKNAKWLLEHHELSKVEFSKSTNIVLSSNDGVFSGSKLSDLENLLKEITNGKSVEETNPTPNVGNSTSVNNPKK